MGRVVVSGTSTGPPQVGTTVNNEAIITPGGVRTSRIIDSCEQVGEGDNTSTFFLMSKTSQTQNLSHEVSESVAW